MSSDITLYGSDGNPVIVTGDEMKEMEASVVDTGWIYPTYEDGWEDESATWTSKYRKISKMVTIQLATKWTGGIEPADNVAFILPTGFRPAYNISVTTLTSIAPTFSDGYVRTSGKVEANLVEGTDGYMEFTITYMVD